MAYDRKAFEEGFLVYLNVVRPFLKYRQVDELEYVLAKISKLSLLKRRNSDEWEEEMRSACDSINPSPAKLKNHVSDDDMKTLIKRIEYCFKYHFFRLDIEVQKYQAHRLCFALRVPDFVQVEWHL